MYIYTYIYIIYIYLYIYERLQQIHFTINYQYLNDIVMMWTKLFSKLKQQT